MRPGLILLLLAVSGAAAQVTPAADPQLLAEISRMGAIDNHTHVEKVKAPGEKDTESDALPCPEDEPALTPAMARSDIPELVDAWRALYAYPFHDRAPEHLAQLAKKKQQVHQVEGEHFPVWALDKLNIEIMFANRVAMGPGLVRPRFRWVPFDDALMYPLNNDGLKAENPDRRFFFAREEALLARYMKDLGLSSAPATLDEYLTAVVTPTLERQKQAGAVAMKFEMAYLRSLEVHDVDRSSAAKAYAALRGRPLTVSDTLKYEVVQDFILKYLAQEGGRLGLPLHFHTGFGCGSYFKLAGANPLLLEALLDDAGLRKTAFVFLHGGWPWSREMAVLLTKPNVYTDTSEQSWFLPVNAFAPVLRQFLEFAPEKVLFGTDLYGADEPIGSEGDGASIGEGWEEVGWITNRRVRDSLAIALSGMVRDGETTRERALEIARMVLNGNARKLYQLRSGR
jgi:hypothetical protein